MNRLTKLQSKIANAHLQASANDKFNPIHIGNVDDLVQGLIDGYTFPDLYREIEMRYVPVGSILMASGTLFSHQSASYKATIRRGFKNILNGLNIK